MYLAIIHLHLLLHVVDGRFGVVFGFGCEAADAGEDAVEFLARGGAGGELVEEGLPAGPPLAFVGVGGADEMADAGRGGGGGGEEVGCVAEGGGVGCYGGGFFEGGELGGLRRGVGRSGRGW